MATARDWLGGLRAWREVSIVAVMAYDLSWLKWATVILACYAGLLTERAVAKTVITSAPVGRLAVVKEVYADDGPPIMHSASGGTENRLEWVSADHRLRFFLSDSGAELTARYTYANPGRAEWVCTGGGYPQSYQSNTAPKRRWKTKLRAQLSSLLKLCAVWVSPDRQKAYLAEYLNAADDFPEAFALLKQEASKDFGGWQRRCLKRKVDRDYLPSPAIGCVRYSSKQE